jgi:predicted HNH restriction endonuclease
MCADKPRKSLKEACKAAGIPYEPRFAARGGQVTKYFFQSLAWAVGLHSNTISSLDKVELAKAIASHLAIKWNDDMKSEGARITDVWFFEVIPKLHAQAGLDKFGHKSVDFGVITPSFTEGDRRLVQHLEVERSSEVVELLKSSTINRDSSGFIICEACSIAPAAMHGFEIIEAHHKIPVSEAGIKRISIEDFVLLCPNCHRAVHKGASLQIKSVKGA